MEISRLGRDGLLALVHLRCTNCGYGRMRSTRETRISASEPKRTQIGRRTIEQPRSDFLHRCELCRYPEWITSALYPRALWEWDPEAYQQEDMT